MYCEHCGKQIADDSVFCEFCGEVQSPSKKEEAPAAETVPTPAAKPQRNHTGMVILVIAIVLTVLFGVAVGILVGGPADKTPPADDAVATDTQTDAETDNVAQVMPSLTGKTVDEATAALETLGITAQIDYVYDDTAEKDTVIAQVPAAEAALSVGDSVTLTVSLGKDPACPYDYTQKVTVEAAPGSSTATLTLYEWDNGDWKELFHCGATVGSNGIDAAYGEGTKRTPLGTFPLGVALTANDLNNRDWPVYYVTSDTCVVDDTSSPYYNTIQSISALPSYVHYDAIGQTIINGYTSTCIYIEHNGNGYTSQGVVAGKGSLITLCGRNGSLGATAGCIDIRTADMNTLLSLLDYEQNPHIETKVNG